MFSGGLDSLAGAIEEIVVKKRKVALVRVGIELKKPASLEPCLISLASQALLIHTS